ncbi:unnamed protein product [Leuciscus chuanchicus]
MEGRLDSIDAHLATLQSKHHEVERHIDGMDEALTDADHHITALETTCKELQAANTRLSAKLNDLGRSRRLNIRIIGIKEGEENSRPAEFVSELISKILGQENFSKPVKIDRAHRSLKPKPKEKEPPRVIIAKLHNDRDVRNILRLSRQRASLSYKDERVSIFPDFTAEVIAQRQAFNSARNKLADAGAKCTMRFPAKLQVTYNKTVNVFDSPAAAERFANSITNDKDDGDRHVICVSCLGEGHAALALADGGCPHCELMPMATLRTRMATFHEPALPAATPRRKKRRAQRIPEPPTEKSSPVRLPALPSASLESLTPGQWPPLAAASAGDDKEEAAVFEEDSCSILASDSEDWASSVDLAPSSARESSGKRASIEAELMRLLTQATESLGLEWSAPAEPTRNRLNGCFLQGDRVSTPSRPAPFLPELHKELAKSWSAPFSARLRSSASAAFSVVDGAKDRGYLALPLVEEAVAAHLCPPSAGRRTKTALPSKACRATSTLHSRAYTAAGQAASALHTMATLQIFQANLLRKLDEEGTEAVNVADLRSATDLALRATKSAAQAIGRNMASLTVAERHLWLTLSEMPDSERSVFLDAPVSATGLFGSSVKDFADRFAEVQKTSQAMKHFLPKRSSSASGRSKQPSARSSQPPPPAAASQRRQARDQRPRSRSAGRRPPQRGTRPKIEMKPEASKSS